jgi:ceramide glucosyltransferase
MLNGIVVALLVVSALRGVSALRNQRSFWRRTEAALRQPPTGYAPRTSVVAPVKGVDPDFEATLAGLLSQRYGAPYELLFVVESERDPAFEAIVRARDAAGRDGTGRTERVEIIVAGRAVDRGQKVHNQTEALKRASADAEVFAFVDSDGRPGTTWLADLVEPLADAKVGVATGFRWYVPIRGGFASALASLWNAMAVTLIGGSRRAFAWGGAMALRRETFTRANVLARWRGSISDDGGISMAVRDAKLEIAFVPKCLVPSLHDFTAASLWEFVVRQYVVLRVYTPHVHRLALLSMALSVTGFAGGIVLSVVGLAQRRPSWAVFGLTLLVYALNVALGAVRYARVRAVLPTHAEALEKARGVYLWGGPIAWGLNLGALFVSSVRRTLVWRGIRYELRSASELLVVHPERD